MVWSWGVLEYMNTSKWDWKWAQNNTESCSKSRRVADLRTISILQSHKEESFSAEINFCILVWNYEPFWFCPFHFFQIFFHVIFQITWLKEGASRSFEIHLCTEICSFSSRVCWFSFLQKSIVNKKQQAFAAGKQGLWAHVLSVAVFLSVPCLCFCSYSREWETNFLQVQSEVSPVCLCTVRHITATGRLPGELPYPATMTYLINEQSKQMCLLRINQLPVTRFQTLS